MNALTATAPRLAPLQVADVEFHPLSATEWRVCDRRYPRQSIDSLLGFVARQGEFFYATRMHHPLEVAPLASLDGVAAYFVEHSG